MAGFELKEATLEGAEGKGFAVVLPEGDRQRCEGRIVFSDIPGPDLMKSIVEGSRVTYEGPVYHGDEEYRKSIPVISQKADFEAEQPYVDFVTVPSTGKRTQPRRQAAQPQSAEHGRPGEVTVHNK